LDYVVEVGMEVGTASAVKIGISDASLQAAKENWP
jgi:hypothetical protein